MALCFSFSFRFVLVCSLAPWKGKGRDFVFSMSVLCGVSRPWVITAPVFLQPSPSTSSLSSTHSASPNVTSSAPSSARGQWQGVGLTQGAAWELWPSGSWRMASGHGTRALSTAHEPRQVQHLTLTILPFLLFPASPLLSDKHKHSRENSCLSPRERPCSAIYPTPVEPSQVVLGGRRS